MRATPSFVKKSLGILSVALLVVGAVDAQVLTLDFAGGNGTTSVDQFKGIAGSGWKGAWITSSGSGITSTPGTVINTSPLTTGGGNYLSMSFTVAGTGTNATQYALASRQIDSTAISLSSPITYSFIIRPDSIQSNSTETLLISSEVSVSQNTSSTNTWSITSSGGGWAFSNGGSSVTAGLVGATSNIGGSAFQFTIVSDPSTRTYKATILNLTNASALPYNSGTLAWRADAGSTENTYLNFVGLSGSSTAGASFGYSLDSLAVVPEPGTTALAVLGGLSILAVCLKRRRCQA